MPHVKTQEFSRLTPSYRELMSRPAALAVLLLAVLLLPVAKRP